MALFLQCFPPDSLVKNYGEFFLRSHTTTSHASYMRARARALIALVYPRKRLGALRKVPTEEQITTMLLADDETRGFRRGYGRLGTHATATQHTTLHSACGAARQSPVRLARSVSRARFSRLLHSTQGTNGVACAGVAAPAAAGPSLVTFQILMCVRMCRLLL